MGRVTVAHAEPPLNGGLAVFALKIEQSLTTRISLSYQPYSGWVAVITPSCRRIFPNFVGRPCHRQDVLIGRRSHTARCSRGFRSRRFSRLAFRGVSAATQADH